ncbi:MAG: diguanylate cyclase [Leptolinea sp.]|jgi:diguanylate cyclase (GGDEF)-like protein|nr:diguanylate cyclase [Leptolinea sp.]
MTDLPATNNTEQGKPVLEDDVVFLPALSTEDIHKLGEKIEGYISRKDTPLHFGFPLEDHFRTENRQNNRQSLLIGSIIAILVYDLSLLVDYIILTDVFTTALIVRLGVFTPLAILALFINHRWYRFWLQDLSRFLIVVAAGISYIYLTNISTDRDAIFYFPALILVVTYGNLFFRLQFIYACLSSAIMFVLFALFFPLDPHLPPMVPYTNSVFFLTSIIMTIFANYFLDREYRYNFLFSFREKIRKRILQDQNRYLNQISTMDALTGLANRREVDNYLSNLNQMRPEVLSIIMIDIDYFKEYNDIYGHAAGDSCLHQVASIIQTSIHRKRDLAGRYGGEEFIIILPETELAAGEKIARNIVQDVRKAGVQHSGSKVSHVVTISAGLACGEIAGSGDVFTVLKAADDSLYTAKSSGRNQVQVKPV